MGGCNVFGFGKTKIARAHIPPMVIIGNDAHASFVIPNQSTGDGPTIIGVKDDSIANREVEHAGVSPHLMEEAQPFNDFLVEFNQLSFR